MTKNESFDLAERFTDDNCGMFASEFEGMPNLRQVDKSDGAYRFVKWLYDNNMEIVDRTIDEDTIAELEKDIADSMKFDNPLSGGE